MPLSLSLSLIKILLIFMFVFILVNTLSCIKSERLSESKYVPGKYHSLAISNTFPSINTTMAKTYGQEADYYYALSLADATPVAITHSVSVADPQNQGYTIYWFIDGVQQSNDNATSMQIDYTLFGVDSNARAGLHEVEVYLCDKTGNVIQHKVWVINILRE
ncbi:MAG: hypothetical protein HQK51_12965 [Oligoflexia bacterium]|nr:hypothetical protein [Oligoflexia bacterium]